MNKGFTLVELSVVLVIIGLIVGGITFGADMIRAAELNNVITEYKKYQEAVDTFKFKYKSLPGDMSDAQGYWGVAHATPATCATTASTGTETCNGDDDGTIDVSAGSNERFRFWQHLANAELIVGSFNGIAGSGGTNHAVKGDNVPSSKVGGNVIWHVMNIVAPSASCCYSEGDYNNALFIGGEREDSWPGTMIFTTTEAHRIDNKIDDGHASQGFVWGVHYKECTLADDTTGTDTDLLDYDLSAEGLNCTLAFRDVF